ncbi:hypothetical protein Aduo_017947 [Ancylostoma duodenale]
MFLCCGADPVLVSALKETDVSSRLVSCHLPVCGLIAITELRGADHKARSNNTDNPITGAADATCARPLVLSSWREYGRCYGATRDEKSNERAGIMAHVCPILISIHPDHAQIYFG